MLQLRQDVVPSCSVSDMSRHRYSVTQRLPWIKGGRLGPHFTWIGGEPILYEPGMTMVVDDRDVAIHHCLTPTDDAGDAVLERARAELSAPATVTWTGDLDPQAVACESSARRKFASARTPPGAGAPDVGAR